MKAKKRIRTSTRVLRIGLLASSSLRRGPASALVRFLRDFEHYFVEVANAELYAMEGTYRTLLRNGLFQEYDSLFRIAPGYAGGIVTLTSMVVRHRRDHTAEAPSLDAVIYLVNPRDATSLYPESLALKRECVVHDEKSPSRVFIPTYRGACEWATLFWFASQDQSVSRYFVERKISGRILERPELPDIDKAISSQTIALIAHDDKKEEMLNFTRRNIDLLRTFKGILATGTTGTLLNGEVPDRLPKAKMSDNLRKEFDLLVEALKTAGIKNWVYAH